MTKLIRMVKYKLKIMLNLNGHNKSGLKNGKKLYFYQTLKLAFHTLIIKQWLLEINLLRRMVVFQLTKL